MAKPSWKYAAKVCHGWEGSNQALAYQGAVRRWRRSCKKTRRSRIRSRSPSGFTGSPYLPRPSCSMLEYEINTWYFRPSALNWSIPIERSRPSNVSLTIGGLKSTVVTLRAPRAIEIHSIHGFSDPMMRISLPEMAHFFLHQVFGYQRQYYDAWCSSWQYRSAWLQCASGIRACASATTDRTLWFVGCGIRGLPKYHHGKHSYT